MDDLSIELPPGVERPKPKLETPPKPSAPVCPACGAKFSHSQAMQKCIKCGLPDEVASLGPWYIRKWQKEQARSRGISKKAMRRSRLQVKTKRRNKHGRKGAKRA